MLWRVGSALLLVCAGCTAIRPLDPVGDAGRADAGIGDASIDAASLLDTGTTLDVGTPDTGSDASLDAGNDAATSRDTGPDTASDANCGVEVCGGGDEDCDGTIDEADAVGTITYYPDLDHDNYGATSGAMMACHAPLTGGPWITRGGDCDDTNRQINPSRSEVCNGLDDDCNGLIDDGLTTCGFACMVRTYGGHTYLFCNENRTQSSAATQCMSMGYHLVDIGDQAENDFIQTTASGLGIGTGGLSGGVWIGLMQVGMTPSYMWTDGTIATFFKWDPTTAEPNGTGPCVRMRATSGLWGDSLCSTNYAYICEAP